MSSPYLLWRSSFRFIYARGMFHPEVSIMIQDYLRFNSYMHGECFRIINIITCLWDVSTHICAGNVSWTLASAMDIITVSTHICVGNVLGRYYVSICCAVVSTHICAGNVFTYEEIFGEVEECFNSYMRGDCFEVCTVWRRRTGFNSYMRGECFTASPFPLRADKGFNSYVRGECFGRTPAHHRYAVDVSTHICVWNVSG